MRRIALAAVLMLLCMAAVCASGEAPEPAVLTFSSYDGGGLEYSVEIEDASLLTYTAVREDTGDEAGSGFRTVFAFTGLKPGTTAVHVHGRSPIMENEDWAYTAQVDEQLNVTLSQERRIAYFSLFRNGDIALDNYTVTLWQDGYHVSVNEGENRPISREDVDKLLQVVDQYDLVQWDGFDASNEYVLDGEAFWLEIRMTDGTSISAHGNNRFPAHYFDAVGSMQEILDSALRKPRIPGWLSFLFGEQ